MLQVSVRTDVGRTRSVNQDKVFASTEPFGPLPNLFIVADGMGGHNGGEIASESAVTHFCDYIKASEQISAEGTLDLLLSAAHKANNQVLSQSKAVPELSGMGTTLTACTISDNKCTIIHIGDSRAYTIDEHKITQITNDHSFVNEMIKAGQITKNEAKDHPKRNVLTRALGIASDLNADGYIHEIEQGSTILLCSDGLYNMVQECDIKNIINFNPDPITELIITANNHGGFDNISAIIIKPNDELLA